MTREWKLIPHSYQIADTGDYDGHYEITDGKVSLFTQDDDDESLLKIVEVLNETGISFYLNDLIALDYEILKYQIKDQEERYNTDICEFAEWCSLNEWTYDNNREIWWRDMGTGEMQYEYKTTSDLQKDWKFETKRL